MRESFVFYRSFFEALSDLSDEMKGRIVTAISDYALNGKSPELTGVEKSIFTLIKPQIDANNKKYENGKLGKNHGKKGGRPSKNNPTETPKEPQENPKQTPNDNVNVNDNVINGEDLSETKDRVGRKTPDNELWFAGDVIRLTEDDYFKWVEMTGLTKNELWQVLADRDDWYATQTKPVQKKWFFSTANHLKKTYA